MYKHGIYQTEVASDINLPVVMSYGHFVVGTAPVHKVSKDKRKINTLTRLSTYREAVEYFGDTYDLDFSVSQAIKVFFELYAVAPLYIVNILNPEIHKKTGNTLSLSLTKGRAVIKNHKIIPETVIVKNSADSQVIVDARLIWTEEGLEIFARPSTGDKIDVEFEEIDLSKVTKTN